MIDEVRTYQPDLVISANTPLDAQKAILSETRRQKAAFIFWLHDFIGIAAHSILSKKLPIAGNLIGGHYKRLERNLLRRSDAIVAITEDFCPTLRSWGISENKVEVIPNWAPLEELPVSAKKNSWSREHGLDEGFNFLYTGTLRMKHDPAILIELATSVNHDEQSARVVVTSEGPGAEWLRDQASLLGLKNFKILNFQPMEQYSEVLASSDVLIAILEKEAGAFSVPSKVLSYLCAKRPLLLAIPKENLAAKIIESNKAGIVVEPDDFDAFTQGAQTLISSPDLRDEMGENARKYAEASFDINSIADRFEEIIVSL
jgi:glycosyltransferase involved in cell wall biosynthesis